MQCSDRTGIESKIYGSGEFCAVSRLRGDFRSGSANFDVMELLDMMTEQGGRKHR